MPEQTILPGQEWEDPYVHGLYTEHSRRVIVSDVSPDRVQFFDMPVKRAEATTREYFEKNFKLRQERQPQNRCYWCVPTVQRPFVMRVVVPGGLHWFCQQHCREEALIVPASTEDDYVDKGLQDTLWSEVGCPACRSHGRDDLHLERRSDGLYHCFDCDHEFFASVQIFATRGAEGLRLRETLRQRAGGLAPMILQGFDYDVVIGENPVTVHPFKRGDYWVDRSEPDGAFKVLSINSKNVYLEQDSSNMTECRVVPKERMLEDYEPLVIRTIYDRLLDSNP